MGIRRDGPSRRKGLRVGHRSERSAINAVRTLLECHGLVVDEVDGRSDYGRDLNVDLTNGSEITGGIIGIQVKGGSSFFKRGEWIIPASPVDWEYWRSSTVPIIGMVHDPSDNAIRWRNLTQLARSRVIDAENSYYPAPRSDEATEVVVSDVLDDTTFGSFIRQTNAYLAATADSAFLLLVNPDDAVRRRGVFNCWTLGRRDPRPLILLRRLLPSLSGLSLLDAITVLAHATPHPDIFWTKENWISPLVEEAVQASFRWSPDELVALVQTIETMDDNGVNWQRGGVGQSLWSIMVIDPDLHAKLPAAIRSCVNAGWIQAAIRLVVCLQFLADDPVADVDAIMAANPTLARDEMVEWVVQELHERGRFPLY